MAQLVGEHVPVGLPLADPGDPARHLALGVGAALGHHDHEAVEALRVEPPGPRGVRRLAERSRRGRRSWRSRRPPTSRASPRSRPGADHERSARTRWRSTSSATSSAGCPGTPAPSSSTPASRARAPCAGLLPVPPSRGGTGTRAARPCRRRVPGCGRLVRVPAPPQLAAGDAGGAAPSTGCAPSVSNVRAADAARTWMVRGTRDPHCSVTTPHRASGGTDEVAWSGRFPYFSRNTRDSHGASGSVGEGVEPGTEPSSRSAPSYGASSRSATTSGASDRLATTSSRSPSCSRTNA